MATRVGLFMRVYESESEFKRMREEVMELRKGYFIFIFEGVGSIRTLEKILIAACFEIEYYISFSPSINNSSKTHLSYPDMYVHVSAFAISCIFNITTMLSVPFLHQAAGERMLNRSIRPYIYRFEEEASARAISITMLVSLVVSGILPRKHRSLAEFGAYRRSAREARRQRFQASTDLNPKN